MVTKTTEKKSLLERLRNNDVRNGESGLALLDVLIGMAIFALIALIALSSLSQYRQKAYLSGAQSDAKSVGTAAEAESINLGVYSNCVRNNTANTDYQLAIINPATGAPSTGSAVATGTSAATACTAATAAAENIPIGKITRGNQLLGYKTIAPTGTQGAGFKFCVQHLSQGVADAYALYDSTKGGLYESDTGRGCPTSGW